MMEIREGVMGRSRGERKSAELTELNPRNVSSGKSGELLEI